MPVGEMDQQRDQEQETGGGKEKRTVPVGVCSDRIRWIREAVQSPTGTERRLEKQSEKSAFCTKIRKNGKACVP